MAWGNVHRPGDRGQTALEFALTAQLFLLIVLGIVDFGRAVWHFNALAEAAREGTRYATVHGSASPSPVGPGAASYTPPDFDSTVETVVRRYAVGMDSTQVTVIATWPDGDNNVGSDVSVEARYSYVPLSTMIVGGVSVPLRAVSRAIIVY